MVVIPGKHQARPTKKIRKGSFLLSLYLALNKEINARNGIERAAFGGVGLGGGGGGGDGRD